MKFTQLGIDTFLLAAVSLPLQISALAGEPTATDENGFVSLCNGQSLDGWYGDPRFWSVVDGVIRGQTTEDNRAEHNDKGVCHVGWGEGWTYYPKNKNEKQIHEEPQLHKPGAQNVPELWADFINAIESGKRPTCDIEIGHHSTTLSLLGMLSWKLGRSVKWDGEREECPGDDEANKMLRREYRDPWRYPEV